MAEAAVRLETFDLSDHTLLTFDQEQRIYTEIINCVNPKLTELEIRSQRGSVSTSEAELWVEAGRRMGLDWRID